jgi:hypothetical protein
MAVEVRRCWTQLSGCEFFKSFTELEYARGSTECGVAGGAGDSGVSFIDDSDYHHHND